jgi:peptide-methionine (S)-S-oxide reductase
VEPGYAGGTLANPTYERVSEGNTGHAEVIRLTYDPKELSYEDLLMVFFGSHDPTTLNRQGADVGEQYRSVIFYQTPEEKATAERVIKEIDASLKDGSRVVTELKAFEGFFPAEDYHKNYCQIVIEPKIEKVRKRFAALVRQV